LMVDLLKIWRSITPGNRPAGGTYGEPYVNFGDMQLGVFNSSNVATDLLGVPVFSTTHAYAAGNVVNYQGTIYVASVAVAAGAWNAAQWIPVTPSTASPTNNLLNGKLVESHATNAATFSIQTLSGATPSATNPVGVTYQDGSVQWITVALSLTIPSGATLGESANAAPFRLWFAVANNAGAPLLIVRNCTNLALPAAGATIVGFDPRGILTTVAISASANNPQVNYAVSAVSNMQYRVIGYADYDSGLATRGTWIVSPTRIVLQSPSNPLPGSIVATASMYSGTQSSVTTGTNWSSVQLNAALTSPSNIAKIIANADCYALTAGATALYGSNILARMPQATGTPITPLVTYSIVYSISSYPGMCMFSAMFYDAPQTTVLQTWGIRINSGGIATYYSPFSFGAFFLEELMG
jgi:hypothetical protein